LRVEVEKQILSDQIVKKAGNTTVVSNKLSVEVAKA